MESRTLTKHEFARLLRRGQGRAVTFLRQTPDPAPFLPALRRACLRVQFFDAQFEHERGQFLLDALRAAGILDEEAPKLREKLLTTKGDVQWQLFDLVGAMARAGDDKARQAMRDAFAKNARRKNTTGASEIIEADGLDGFLFVAEHVAAWLAPDDENNRDASYFAGLLDDQTGEENTDAALAQATENNPLLADWIQKLQAQRAAHKKERNTRRPRTTPNESEIREALDSDTPWTTLRILGRRADDATALTFARELLTETDTKRQTRLLHFFRLRKEPFPFGPLPILELARSGSEEQVRAACHVLERIAHPDVRAFALETDGLTPLERARLLVQNPGDGDWPRFAAWLAEPMSDDELHWLGHAVFHAFERQPSTDAAETLTRVYEIDPCSMCRTTAVKHLLALDALPDALRDECRWDAEPETRRLVS